jgi:hypothetical protein
MDSRAQRVFINAAVCLYAILGFSLVINTMLPILPIPDSEIVECSHIASQSTRRSTITQTDKYPSPETLETTSSASRSP